MLSRSPLPEPSAVEPVSVMSGGGRITVRLADAAGRGLTLRMDEPAASLLAAMLAAGRPPGRAAPGTAAMAAGTP